MSKYLIINADDFGMCHAANIAVFDLFEKGGITSSTVMTPCGWAPEALMFAKEHPEYAIGVHLTFTSEWKKYKWRPVSTGPNSSLRDETGYMHFHCDGFEKNAVPSEVEAEIRAQVAFAKQYGLNPSHLDNHMGSLYGLEGIQNFLPLVFRLCAEMDYPFRMPLKQEEPKEVPDNLLSSMADLVHKYNIATPDYLWEHNFNGPQKESYENFRSYMLERFRHCPDGFVETYIHPAVECDELKNTTSVWQRRVWEYRFFADPDTRKYIEAQGIKLIDYRELKKLRNQ
jgi:predicted glycoside hydrolase/deacetylase ChbG (UPF0249 family)